MRCIPEKKNKKKPPVTAKETEVFLKMARRLFNGKPWLLPIQTRLFFDRVLIRARTIRRWCQRRTTRSWCGNRNRLRRGGEDVSEWIVA